MRAALAFALRRASARLVLVLGAGGLVLVVYRAVRPVRRIPAALLACGGDRCLPAPRYLGSSPWDLAAAALVAVLAVVAAAALYRRVSTGGHPLATFRAGRARAPRAAGDRPG